jgi:hypothetical protein
MARDRLRKIVPNYSAFRKRNDSRPRQTPEKKGIM